MRRFLLCVTATAVVLACLAMVVEAGGKGAVKTDLKQQLVADELPGSGPVAGWVIANTTAKGVLIINARLKDGVAKTDFTVSVWVNGTCLPADLGSLSTNRRGKGYAHLKLKLSDYLPADYAEDTVQVQVVVDNGDPVNVPPPYGYATDLVDVHLKK